jgi:hypothetical protein
VEHGTESGDDGDADRACVFIMKCVQCERICENVSHPSVFFNLSGISARPFQNGHQQFSGNYKCFVENVTTSKAVEIQRLMISLVS